LGESSEELLEPELEGTRFLAVRGSNGTFKRRKTRDPGIKEKRSQEVVHIDIFSDR